MAVVNKPEWINMLESSGIELRNIHATKANWPKIITWFAGVRAVIAKHCPEQLSAFEKTMDVDFPKTTYAGAIPDKYELSRRQNDEERRHDEIVRNTIATLSKQFFTVLKMVQQDYENTKREELKRKQLETESERIAKEREHLDKIRMLMPAPVVHTLISNPTVSRAPVVLNKEIFIVHGHDDAMKQSVARLIESLGLIAKILDEQPNKGGTVIEKLLANSDVTFAVVLLSEDDKAYHKSETPRKAKNRARQNVILELGYFIGKIGRPRTCILKKGNIELPSDVDGIGWNPYDDGGGWKLKLAGELRAAGYDIDVDKLLKGNG